MANMPNTLYVDVVNAEQSVYSGKAVYVGLPGAAGSLGVLPGHVPLITRIHPGEVVIRMENGEEEHVFVAGGILEVQPGRVTVLADTAVRSRDLDEAKAKLALESAQKDLEQAKSDREIAKLQAAMSALSAQIAFIRKLRR